jgi:hypothetical protein
MIASALFMGIAGLVLTFAPGTVGKYLDMPVNSWIVLQLLGALYFGFAILNWMGKGILIGGIYSKPVSLGNYAHYFIGGLALIKFGFRGPGSVAVWIALIIYLVFAIAFAYVSFSAPKPKVRS